MSVAFMDEFNNKEFELPGIESRGYASYSLATSLMNSSRYNMRGVEYYSYGFYAILLQDLIDHLAPRALVIPQFGLGTLTVELDQGESSDSDSVVTCPQKTLSEVFPDFAVVLLRAVVVDGAQPVTASTLHRKFEPWGNIKIERLSIGILAEAKRRPTRTASDQHSFIKNLTSVMDRAKADLDKQAVATFRAYMGTNRVILIAFAGEWFCWRLAKRKDYITKKLESDTIHISMGSPSAQAETNHVAIQASHSPSDDISVPQSNRQPYRTTRNPNPIYDFPPSLEDLESSKVPYNPNPARQRRRAKGSAHPQKSSKPQKAVLKRFVPADLADVVDIQNPLTNEDWQHLNQAGRSVVSRIRSLMASEWSGFILFGTQQSRESWFLLGKVLEEQIARLDSKSNTRPGDESSDSENEGVGDNDNLAAREGLDPDECGSLPNSDDEYVNDDFPGDLDFF
ncbi:hypothetical protein H2248_011015 [Termitomyces sp. 'cryptogamus']|nr:hypothetical protein H2248_011015 [Termitomyces sp. 'cryptogamus']